MAKAGWDLCRRPSVWGTLWGYQPAIACAPGLELRERRGWECSARMAGSEAGPSYGSPGEQRGLWVEPKEDKPHESLLICFQTPSGADSMTLDTPLSLLLSQPLGGEV